MKGARILALLVSAGCGSEGIQSTLTISPDGGGPGVGVDLAGLDNLDLTPVAVDLAYPGNNPDLALQPIYDLAGNPDLAVPGNPDLAMQPIYDLAGNPDIATYPVDLASVVDLAGASCGSVGKSCCTGNICASNAICSAPGGECIACGGPGQYCCATGTGCAAGYYCVDGTNCVACGDTNQPCCPPDNSCASGGCCVGGQCVSNGGLCYFGTSSTACSSGHCSGCGAIGQVCCQGICQDPYSFCNSFGTCEACGSPGERCCGAPGCRPGSTCSGNGFCAPCGDPGEPCCNGTTCNSGACVGGFC